MDIVTWGFPTTVRFGVGAAASTGAELDALGVSRPLLVTDAGVEAAGLLKPIISSCMEAKADPAVFAGVAGNPTEAHVDAGVVAYDEHRADCIIAVGGGSPMDAAKVIALRIHHRDRPLGEFDDATGGDRLVTGEVPPILTLPTTAGTGSEVGRSGVVTLASDAAPRGRKTVIFSPKLLPRVALLDPELTRTMPKRVTAATGYDALTHCLEALVAKGDHPMCDGIALEGIRLVHRSLRRAYANGDDIEARGDMMKAAMMGAVAFQKGLGACHSLAHPLGAICDMHHGLANAVCLPAVVDFNLEAAEAAYAQVDALLGGAGVAGDCRRRLADLRGELDIPATLAAAGVSEPPLELLADEAFSDVCHRVNPRACTRDDLKALFEAVAG